MIELALNFGQLLKLLFLVKHQILLANYFVQLLLLLPFIQFVQQFHFFLLQLRLTIEILLMQLLLDLLGQVVTLRDCIGNVMDSHHVNFLLRCEIQMVSFSVSLDNGDPFLHV